MDENQNTLKCIIIKEIATLSENGKWKKQFNIVQWGENIAKYDIRAWNEDHTKSGKGITLTVQEMIALKAALEKIDF